MLNDRDPYYNKDLHYGQDPHCHICGSKDVRFMILNDCLLLKCKTCLFIDHSTMWYTRRPKQDMACRF